jgi:cobalt-zinc-cadmium efflux system outer membrane protein
MGPFEYRPLEGSLRAWLARRRAESGALGIARLEVERARSDLRLARLTTYPDFEVGLFYQRLNESRPESFLAAELSIDLPVWRDRPQGREMTAVAELRAAQIRSAATERRLEADVRDAFAGAATNENRVELFRDRLLEDTEAALENAIDVYRNGRLDAVALLDAYRTSKEVRIDYLETLEGYLRALVRLQTAGEFDALETAQSRPAAEEEVSP